MSTPLVPPLPTAPGSFGVTLITTVKHAEPPAHAPVAGGPIPTHEESSDVTIAEHHQAVNAG